MLSFTLPPVDLSLGYYCTAFYFVLCSDLLFYGEELSRLPSATMGVGMGVGRSQTHRVNRTFELKEIRIVMMPSEKDLSFFLLTPTKGNLHMLSLLHRVY